MKYIREFGIIIVISLIGELLNYLIPLPIPSSIYGLVIMFLCLHFKIVKVADVKKTAVFLIEIMPLMFIPAAVGIIESWDIIKPNVIAYAIITIVSTVLVMAVAGRVTQRVIRHSKKGDKE
jgi:holin-like protein